MKYKFDSIVDRKGTSCIKYDECHTVFGNANVIPMWIADMDFEAPDFICKAIQKRSEHKVYGYAVRDDEYYNAIINWIRRRNGWTVERDWIDFTPGVVAGFVFAIRTLTKEGDGVVIMPPTYPPFAAQIKANDRVVIDNPLILENGRYVIDYEDLDRKLANAKALLFCNPHNPSGRVFTKEELQKVGELCIKHGVGIISDEIHSDLVHKPHKHTHIASMCREFGGKCITFVAPSKTFNLAGFSTSVAITPCDDVRAAFREELNRYHVDQGNVFGTCTLTAAYNEGEEWLEELLEYVAGNMKFVVDFCAENIPEIKAYPGEGTYMMWLNFRDMGMTHEELREFLVEKAGVGLNDGEAFGAEGRGFMRINLATSREIVGKALRQIAEAYRQL